MLLVPGILLRVSASTHRDKGNAPARSVIAASIATLALASCTLGGTLDNVPKQPVVEVTRVTPQGPTSSGRPECPANPPTNSCATGTRYRCDLDTNTGCDVCSCAP
jgi:hypothetical protein